MVTVTGAAFPRFLHAPRQSSGDTGLLMLDTAACWDIIMGVEIGRNRRKRIQVTAPSGRYKE
ncbi:MAG: hypothetical protein DRP79_02275, partial [Planctomycetota bacterium]